ncbi:zinc finger, CCHC-type containing protein [Tanacetum coccineum]
MNAIFDENRFSSVPRPSLRIPNRTKDIGGSVVPEEVTKEVVQQPEPELRKSKRNRTLKNFRPEFQLYLIKGTSDEKQLMMRWTPSWATTLRCWLIYLYVANLLVANGSSKDGTIEKFKARQVIQGFKQNSGIDYFDTYALVARISTIRLLVAMASIHNLIIHQMDVKTAFLNGELDEEAPKQWHQKFDEVVLSNGYLLNQADKCVYRKFDESGIGVIICLYVDDMLIFGTDQVQVDLTKEFLSSRFSMKDMGEADELVPQPKNMTIIGTKWVFRNKLDENGDVSRNKVRLVAQDYNQQEGIDYDETHSLVARLESIRILLAYACPLDFKLF